MPSRLARSSASLLLLAAATGARAQSTPDTTRLSRVVVTATRAPLPLGRVPASVTVLEGEALRAQGVTLVADALRQVPGITVVQSGSYGAQTSLFLRGGQNNYTKVLVDGVPANDPGGTFDFSTLTVDNVERIEIVRGPASVLYGSDAVTGVVNVITRRAAAAPRGTVEARGGSYGGADVSADAQGALASVGYALGLGHHASRGIYDFNSDYRNTVGGGSLSAAPWRSATLRVSGRYSDVRAEYPTDFTGAPVDSNAARTEKRAIAGGELGQRFASGADLRLAYNSNLSDAVIDDPANGTGPFDVGNEYRTHNRRQSAELRGALPAGALGTVTLGGAVEWQAQRSSSRSTSGTGAGSATASRAARRNRALFGELLAALGATTATVGARLDANEQFGDFGTYRVSVGYRLLPATRLRASVGTAFREPSFAETQPSRFSTGNSGLQPERTASWEAGFEQSLRGDRLALGATYFGQRFVNLIDYQSTAGGSRYENIGRARSNGVELELRAAPARRLSAEASFTYLDTRVLQRGFSASPQASLVQGGRLLRRPMHSGAAGVAYRVPARYGVDLRASYVGAREDRRFSNSAPYTTNVTLDPYTKLDLSADVALVRGALATLRVDNLTGTEYEQVAGYATPGRAIFGGVRFRF